MIQSRKKESKTHAKDSVLSRGIRVFKNVDKAIARGGLVPSYAPLAA